MKIGVETDGDIVHVTMIAEKADKLRTPAYVRAQMATADAKELADMLDAALGVKRSRVVR